MSHSAFPPKEKSKLKRDAGLTGAGNLGTRTLALYAALYNESENFFLKLLFIAFDADSDFDSRESLAEIYEEFMQVTGSTFGAGALVEKFQDESKWDQKYAIIADSLIDLAKRIDKIDGSLFYHSDSN